MRSLAFVVLAAMGSALGCSKTDESSAPAPAATAVTETPAAALSAATAAVSAAAAAVSAAAAAPPAVPANPGLPSGPCVGLALKCPKCTLPLLRHTCDVAMTSGDPKACPQALANQDL